MTKEYTYKEMREIESQEEGSPIRKRWFKHKTKPIYKYQLDIFGEMQDFEEVKE